MPRKLVLCIHSLSGGGAERMLARMASHWSGQGNRVTVITLADADQDRYSLPDQVERVCLGLMQESGDAWAAVRNTGRRLHALRRAIRAAAADRVISFIDQMNVLVLMATRGLAVPVIVCERTDPRRHSLGRAWSLGRRWTYPHCGAAVVQTAAVRPFVQSVVGERPVFVIPNPVDPCPAAGTVQPAVGAPRVCVSLGRLSFEKGFDLLIEAISKIAHRYPDWQFAIYGTGAERGRLESLIRERGLSQVKLPGWTDDPQRILGAASLFVLPSRIEGFPNALLEAMACGLAVVAFDCDSGPREIIQHETNGVLVPPQDVAALAAAMDQLMGDTPSRAKLGNRAREVSQTFCNEQFFEQWETVLSTV